MKPKSAPLIRFQWIVSASGVPFSESSNFYKLKRGDIISWWNQFCRKSELSGPPFCVSILKVLLTQILRHSLDFNAFCMILGTFLRVLKFLEIKGGPNFWGKQILQKVWIIWSAILYLNFKSFMEPNSSSLVRFQSIVHDSGILFSESSNFYKLRRGDLISGGNQFCRVWIIWSPLLYFNFKSFIDQNSLSFIGFQCILHDSGVLFSESWNFYKLNRGDLISERTNFAEILNYPVPPSVFQFWKFYEVKSFLISYISMHSSWFRSTFFQSLEISIN